jgi:hypothetical protein
MSSPVQRFYAGAKSKIEKDSDLPNFFVYYLTIELGSSTATVSEVRKCYEGCDLHPPSWLASHFSVGLPSLTVASWTSPFLSGKTLMISF